MEKQKVDAFMAINSRKFKPELLRDVKQKLETLPDDAYGILSSQTYWDPSIILVIAIFLGWERLFLDDVALGVLKIITCYGLGVWWLVDLFTANSRAMNYNYNKFLRIAVSLG